MLDRHASTPHRARGAEIVCPAKYSSRCDEKQVATPARPTITRRSRSVGNPSDRQLCGDLFLVRHHQGCCFTETYRSS